MKFFRIYVSEGNRDKTLEFVKEFSNDILVENVDDNSIGITIEAEEPEASQLYKEVVEELKQHDLAPIR